VYVESRGILIHCHELALLKIKKTEVLEEHSHIVVNS
jgi:hypothetical protein